MVKLVKIVYTYVTVSVIVTVIVIVKAIEWYVKDGVIVTVIVIVKAIVWYNVLGGCVFEYL